jgi:hypothetical protein
MAPPLPNVTRLLVATSVRITTLRSAAPDSDSQPRLPAYRPRGTSCSSSSMICSVRCFGAPVIDPGGKHAATASTASHAGASIPDPGPCASIFRDKHRRFIGKSQSERPHTVTQRPAHRARSSRAGAPSRTTRWQRACLRGRGCCQSCTPAGCTARHVRRRGHSSGHQRTSIAVVVYVPALSHAV